MAGNMDADSEKATIINESLSPPAVIEVDGALEPEDDATDNGFVERHGSTSSLHIREPYRVDHARRFEEDLDYNYALWQAETAGVCLMSFLVILSGLALLCLLILSMRDQKGLSAILSNILGAAYAPHHKGPQ